MSTVKYSLDFGKNLQTTGVGSRNQLVGFLKSAISNSLAATEFKKPVFRHPEGAHERG